MLSAAGTGERGSRVPFFQARCDDFGNHAASSRGGMRVDLLAVGCTKPELHLVGKTGPSRLSHVVPGPGDLRRHGIVRCMLP